MANTYNLIASYFPTTTPSEVQMTNIPQTYTDLVLRVSTRNNGTAPSLDMYIIPYAFSIGRTTLTGSGTTAASNRDVDDAGVYLDNANGISTYTANTFANAEYYFPNYSQVAKHQISCIAVSETYTGNPYITFNASYDTESKAITQINMNCGNGFVTGSSFYLYGIKNS